MKRRFLAPCFPALGLLIHVSAGCTPAPSPPALTAHPEPEISLAPTAASAPAASQVAPAPSGRGDDRAPELAPAEPIVEPGDHGFAARLYASQAAAHSGNLILSPASARVALGMAYLGARGNTAREMASALGLSADASQAGAEMSASVKAWNEQRDPKVKLAIANGLFGQRGWPVEAPYTSALKQRFGARLAPVDFIADSAGALRTINQFAASHTDNQIVGLLRPDDLTPRTRVVLVNATYFKGEWKTAFPVQNTAAGTFHALAQDVTKPLMHVRGYFGYGERADAQVLVMPYGGGTYSMVVVLPTTKLGLADLEKHMSGAAIDAWLALAHPDEVYVTLPRFELETRAELGEALAGMGMRDAFSDRDADFSGITKPAKDDAGLSISQVIQKARVKVDEKGTVAAAATAIVVAPMPSAPPPISFFTADHPFLYFIRDGLGNVLFIGRVVEP